MKRFSLSIQSAALQIRQEAALGVVVGVRNIVSQSVCAYSRGVGTPRLNRITDCIQCRCALLGTARNPGAGLPLLRARVAWMGSSYTESFVR